MRRPTEPTAISKILANILARRQPTLGVQRDEATRVLRESLPNPLRDRVSVAKVTERSILIHVDSSALMAEFRSFHTQNILAAFRTRPDFSGIVTISYKLGTAHGE